MMLARGLAVGAALATATLWAMSARSGAQPVQRLVGDGADGAGAAAAPASGWVTREVKAPRVSFHVFDSPTAGTKVSYHLYTPAVYEREAERRFPVVYWLHGSGGGLAGIPALAAHYDEAIEAGKTPPALVVFVNGLTNGMYVDWRDGSTPLETVIVRDLVSRVDAAHRTIASREGRMLDGFSMGGYGAARLGFKHTGVFGAVSMLGAGPLQPDLTTTPRAGPRARAEILQRVFGGDQAFFREVSPWRFAEINAAEIARGTRVRQIVGERDETMRFNVDFHRHLTGLKIPHAWKVLPGVAHDTMKMLEALGDEFWTFYRDAFGAVEP